MDILMFVYKIVDIFNDTDDVFEMSRTSKGLKLRTVQFSFEN